ncbi:MAG: ABC transporter ATP-binding protein [Spirochaetales bacterium]|uniref:ABC transporter ATP-binding protein n=1 Tax=Candidatus Thalassospirochaeta sargassi TaxID=3119039 RepID=A0AAJ1IGY0_9SPIO|nr:ABC transporter ATP-binding protein [Spirochaetales bacterium]
MNNYQDAIQISGIGKSYGNINVLKGLNLNVPKNSIFGFLGPNGAGKTTTMKILLGFIKATEGRGTILGKDISRDSIEIRSRIGYLSQEPRFYDNLSTRENLRITARFFFKNNKKAIEKRIDEMLELTGLSSLAERKIKGFSGGERQRLGIAQAQINYPALLILDEPTAALDPIGRKNVLDVMKSLKDKTTIFYSTHILSDVQRVSDAVAILNEGSCIAQGPIEQLVSHKETVYSVKFRKNTAPSVDSLTSIPWISNVDLMRNKEDGNEVMSIRVSDPGEAEGSLLRILVKEPGVVITGYGQKQNDLEDTFLNIIAEGDK